MINIFIIKSNNLYFLLQCADNLLENAAGLQTGILSN